MYRLLVVDDEKIIRDGIISTVAGGTEDFQVGEAADGESALDMVLDVIPDLIITDINMPKVNGIEFIESVKSINPDTKVVIISGYDEFEYAQKALKLGVSDYLLKPIEKDTLLKILNRIKAELDSHNKHFCDMEMLKAQVRESIPAVRERFLNSLVSGKLSNDIIAQKAELLEMDVSGNLYSVALLICDELKRPDISSTHYEELVMCFINDVSKEIFKEGVKAHAFFTYDYKITLLLCFQEKEKQCVFSSMNQNLRRLAVHLNQQFNLNTLITVGRLYENLDEVSKSFSDAERTLQYRLLRNNDAVINYEEISIRQDMQYEKPIELENRLIMHLRLCEKEQVHIVLDQLFEYYRSLQWQNPFGLKMQVSKIISLVLRTMEEVNGINSPSWGIKTNPYEEVIKSFSIEGLREWLQNFSKVCMDELLHVRSGKKDSIIERAKEIIEASLFDPEFNLEQVASRLFISTNYLRQLFKQQVGKSFVEYITGLRMERACTLLEDPLLKVQDIAEKVGYIDPRYFAICFKKAYQMTPSEYREALQLQDIN